METPHGKNLKNVYTARDIVDEERRVIAFLRDVAVVPENLTSDGALGLSLVLGRVVDNLDAAVNHIQSI